LASLRVPTMRRRTSLSFWMRTCVMRAVPRQRIAHTCAA
jgi:hypothetical protein